MHHCQRLSLWYRRVVLNHVMYASILHCTSIIIFMHLYFLSFPSPNNNLVEPNCPIIFISQFYLILKSRPITSNGSPRPPPHPPTPTPAPPYSIPPGEEISDLCLFYMLRRSDGQEVTRKVHVPQCHDHLYRINYWHT